MVSLSEKEGRSGRLAFLELEHEIAANGEPAIRERQTLVYREAAAPDTPLVPPVVGEKLFDPKAWDRVQPMVPSVGFSARSPAIVGDTLHLAVREQGDTMELAALNDAGAVLTTAHASR